MDYCVSVIIPMYNRAHTVGRALESVFRQSLEGIEILVVDDGSTDDSVAVVKEYQKDHPELKLFEAPHGGAGLARNVGLKNAQGKYVAFLDSDDFVPERAYELLYRAAEENNCDFVIGQLARRIDTVNDAKWYVPEKIAQVIRSYVGKNCAGGYDIPINNPSMCNRMIRREFVLSHGLLYSGEMFGEDMVYNLKLFRLADRGTTIDEIVYCYETTYAQAGSTISTMTLEPVLSGMRSVESYALYFDAMGRVDWEVDALLGPFEFVLQRFKLLDEEDKAIAFEEIKKYLKNYQGRKEYAIPIAHLMGLDLDTLLLLPYAAYETCRRLTGTSAGQSYSAQNAAVGANAATLEATLRMYRNGQAGLRYILRYFKAWLRYKLRGK